MNVPIVIPARIGSERIKTKPLERIAKESVIRLISQIARNSQKASNVIVCSDSHEILDSVKGVADTILTNGTYLNGTERAIRSVLSKRPDAIVVLDCGEIMLKSESIDEAIEMVVRKECDVSTIVKPVSGFDMADFNSVKVALSSDSNIMYLSRAPIPYPVKHLSFELTRKNSKSNPFWKHLGAVCYNEKAYKSYLSTPRSDVEETENIDLIRSIEGHMRIKALKIGYEAKTLNVSGDVFTIEQLISSNRIKEGKPAYYPNI